MLRSIESLIRALEDVDTRFAGPPHGHAETGRDRLGNAGGRFGSDGEAESSHSTAKLHLANARTKVGATTTAQLVWILAARLPEPEGVAPVDE